MTKCISNPKEMHEIMKEQYEWDYCPYCGEKL